MSEPTNLIALRDARQAAEQLIGQRYAEDLIDESELERRLEVVQGATTLEEIDAVTVDLRDPESPAGDSSRSSSSAAVSGQEALVRQHTEVAIAPDAAQQRTKLAVFGEVSLKGAWQPAHHNKMTALFGSVVLDFNQVELAGMVTEVEATAIFGSVEIIVPPGLSVMVEATPIMGSVEQDEMVATASSSDGPVVRVTGLAVFGSIEIRERLPGESQRQARLRRRKATKQLLDQNDL